MFFKQKFQASEKYVNFYALNKWLSLLLHELLHQCWVAWRRSRLMEAQVVLIAVFSSSSFFFFNTTQSILDKV